MVDFIYFFGSISISEAKETFSLYDDVGDGKIDCLQIGTVARALGLKPTNAMVHKAAGQEYKREGKKHKQYLLNWFSNLQLITIDTFRDTSRA